MHRHKRRVEHDTRAVFALRIQARAFVLLLGVLCVVYMCIYLALGNFISSRLMRIVLQTQRRDCEMLFAHSAHLFSAQIETR